jgi:uncharacterized protein YdaU (DUF1376 family)
MNEDKRSRKAPAFQFYADDFLAGTITMTNEEKGAYITLLCIQWSKGSLLESDFQRVCAGMPPHSQRICETKFQIDGYGNFRNQRMEQEREKQAAYRAKQKENANKRWVGNANAMPSHMPPHMPNTCSPSPTPTPSNTLNTPLTPQEGGEEVEALKLRIGSWFGRRESTIWSQKEIKALKSVLKLKTPPDDLNALEARYRSSNRYLRKDIITLLNNWNTEIDKSKQTQPINDHENSNDPSRFGPTDAIARRNWLMGEAQARQSAISAAESRAVDQWFIDNDVIPMQPDFPDLPAENPAS